MRLCARKTSVRKGYLSNGLCMSLFLPIGLGTTTFSLCAAPLFCWELIKKKRWWETYSCLWCWVKRLWCFPLQPHTHTYKQIKGHLSSGWSASEPHHRISSSEREKKLNGRGISTFVAAKETSLVQHERIKYFIEMTLNDSQMFFIWYYIYGSLYYIIYTVEML